MKTERKREERYRGEGSQRGELQTHRERHSENACERLREGNRIRNK